MGQENYDLLCYRLTQVEKHLAEARAEIILMKRVGYGVGVLLAGNLGPDLLKLLGALL